MGHMSLNSHNSAVPQKGVPSFAINCTEATVDELRLSLDAIYLNVQFDENTVAKIRHHVDHQLPILKCDSAAAGQPRRWFTRRYTHGFYAYLNDALKYEPTGCTKFHCATGPKFKGLTNTHFNWNPAKCHSEYIAGIIFHEYLKIPPEYLFHATVSRIDLALDVPKIQIDGHAFSWPKMTEVENRYSKGRTMYLGARVGATRVAIYDKRAEIRYSNSKLGPFLSSLHEPVPAHDLTQIEIRLKKLSLPLLELGSLPNPFANLAVQIRPLNFTRLEQSRCDLALHEGLARATSIFTPAEKKAFARKLRKAGGPGWWQPAKVWEAQFAAKVDEFLSPFEFTQWQTNAPKSDPVDHSFDDITTVE